MHSQLTKITINCTAKQSRDSKGEKCSLSGGKIFVITRKEIKGALFEWPIIFMNTVLSPFPSSPSHTKKAVYQLLNRPRTEYWPGLWHIWNSPIPYQSAGLSPSYLSSNLGAYTPRKYWLMVSILGFLQPR